ncbi:hypothetical protein [Roseobacter sp. OBYS 0001]|uniref:hypothetical protein n=1 Tax=Roseobacter sp. OBYS 0001 TaxID=882651 RepID=UPI001BC81C39|nr:hypothetical protein [Roseobacter sp. OBYS 0001]GIT88127.1 hypothetical protein ROBYS_31430 [Roseobacter sp. OBYS 0001]
MNWLIYIGVVCFGAIALLIEARRNYRESLTQTPFQRHPILQDARVSDLCTQKDGFFGFIVYSMLYLVSYAIILSSAELYELIRNANVAKFEVGATASFDPFGNDILNLEGTVYAKPIFVSAFLIAIMSVGVMRPIENMVRSAAHRIAGIPRGVYRVIDALQTQETTRICKTRKPGALTAHFRKELTKAIEAEDEEGAEDQDARLAPDLAGRREEIDKALTIIDALSLAVTPSKRAQYFPVAELEELTKMSRQLECELTELSDLLLGYDPKTTDGLVTLHRTALRVAENTKALFAVHYIRNNQSVKNLDPATPLAKIVHVIDRNYVPEKNSFALSAFFSCFASVVAVFMIYAFWHQGMVDRDFTWADDQIETSIAMFNANPPRQFEQAAPLTLAGCVVPRPSDACLSVIEAGKVAYKYEIRPDLLVQAAWDTLQMALVTLAAAGAVIFGRDVRMEQESWKPGWSMHRIPFLRLLGLCVVPAVLAFILAIAGSLLELAFDSNFQVTQSQIIRQIDDAFIYYAMMPLVGLSVGFGVLVILDKHDDFSRLRTIVMLAVPCAIFVGFLMAAVVFFSYKFDDFPLFEGNQWITYKKRDWLIQAFLPMLFLILFAFFIELTEDRSEDEEGEETVAEPNKPTGWLRKLVEGQSTTKPQGLPGKKDVA